MSEQHDVIDVGEVLGRVRRKGRWVFAGAALGLAAAGGVAYVLGPRYVASTKLLVRGQSDVGSPLARLGGFSDLLSVGGLSASPFDTEIEVLTSRSVVGAVVDSLGLQAQVASPRGMPLSSVLASARWAHDVDEPVEYTFTRTDGGFRVEGPGAQGVARAGQPFRTALGTVVLRGGALPERFTLKVNDFEETVTAVAKRLDASKAGGDVAQLTYTAGDSRTAAAVANEVVGQYLLRRRTVDRGTNAHRYEFLTRQTDSISGELVRAEGALRAYQESSGVIDPREQGKAVFERVADLRAQAEAIDVETASLQKLVRDRGTAPAGSDVMGYPTFLKNPGINSVLTRLLELRTERIKLLRLRTERDADVVALDASIHAVQDELGTLSQSYLSGLQTQRAGVERELARYQGSIAAMPSEGEASTRLAREVKRLGETMIALQTQLVQTRLAAIGEGGDVRQIDPAVAPRNPKPDALILLGLGLFGGLLLGTGGALVRSFQDDRLWTAREVQRATGLAALDFAPHLPLMVSDAGPRGTLLVLAASPSADAGRVAENLAQTSALRGGTVAFVDLTRARLLAAPAPAAPRSPSPAALVPVEPAREEGYHLFSPPEGREWGPGALRTEVEGLEDRFARVVVALPQAHAPAAVALFSADRPVVLVARAGECTSAALRDAVESLRRIGVDTAALVLTARPGVGADD